MSDVWRVVIIALLLLLGALGAVAETVIARMSRVRAHHLDQERQSKATAALVKVVENPAPYLNVSLLLMVGTHVTATVLATVLVIRRLDGLGQLVAAIGMTILVFVLAEVVPKTFAVQRIESAALRLARPLQFFGTLLQPLGALLLGLANALMVLLPGSGLPKGPFVTEEEIRHMVDVAEEEEEIEEEERELIHSIFEFGDTVVREVMVPRPDMVVIESSESLDEALPKILDAGFSRIPIYEGDTDNIVGVLYAKDVMGRVRQSQGSDKVATIGRAPTFVPEQKKVAELLREMQAQRVHMAIVVDEYGGTAGLVTIEDLLEEIVGEIVDEYDKEEPLVEPLGDNRVRVDGRTPIDDVNELLEIDLPNEEWDTVGGLVFGLTGRVPAPGETVRYDSVEFVTEQVMGRRIQKVVITKLPATGEPAVGR
ncbi:MAG: hemolysin family protein [Actinomycetota bacterium]